MFSGKLESIFIGEQAGEPVQELQSAVVEEKTGLVGDRFPKKTGDAPWRQVTLIEAEALDAVGHEYDFELTGEEARRNLVTRGVPLNHLVGEEFVVGDVRLRGIRLCEPCQKLENMTGKNVLDALAHRGGLRAEVVQGGVLHVGDEITVASST